MLGRSTSLSSLSSMSTDSHRDSSVVILSDNNEKPKELPKSFSHVLIPSLSSEAKSQYKPVQQSILLPKVDEIIGEYKEKGRLYYYARYKGGIAHQYPAEGFTDHFPKLVEVYRRQKANGELQPFDPSASYVHPVSRVKMKLNLNKNKAIIKIGSALSEESAINSALEHEETDDEGGTEYDDDDNITSIRLRRSARNQDSQQLPFSPKKTRKVVLTLAEDSEDDSSIKRTLRSRQLKLKSMVYDIDSDESEADTGASEYGGRRVRRRGKGKQRVVHKRKGAIPEYGYVRRIDDIDFDYFSDEDDKPLRAHRGICEKCHLQPANVLLRAWAKKKGRKKKSNEDDETDDEEKIQRLGGWVRCLKCPVTAHWGCLAQTQRDQVLKAIRERDIKKWKEKNEGDEGSPPRRKELTMEETTDFFCGPCSKGGMCMGCMETVLKPIEDTPVATDGEDIAMADGLNQEEMDTVKPSRELFYRCLTCKRLAHYAHLRRPSELEGATLPEVAEHYQIGTAWLCPDCASYTYPLDKIIAWRPYPSNVVEPPRPENQPPPYKDRLPREYLVKWKDRSYRRLTWVPHMWLVSTNPAKLKNFLAGGTKVELLEEPVDDGVQVGNKAEEEGTSEFEIGAGESRASSLKPGTSTPKLPNDAMPDAERRIPPAWKTVDRVLDIILWKQNGGKKKKKRSAKAERRIESDSEEEQDKMLEEAKNTIFSSGEFYGPDNNTETAEQWETRTGRTTSMNEIDKVVWAFFKWDDLGYDEATWDSPPRPTEKGYEAFRKAFERYVFSRTVEVPKLSKSHAQQFDDRVKDEYRKKYMLKDAADLQLGQAPNLRLMPFQVDGFNWLCNNWWNHQHCILADEMGLGKTVQVATFLGFIAAKWRAYPALVVVPNSTITNWVREFERWAPNLRVVPFYGEKKARDVIKQFELFHSKHVSTNTPAKFHILVTTYENITGRDFTTVFKNQNRWEVLIVDEGQRLKSDSSLLFKKLNELNSIHRVIMTGTPLNNNIRELFNLMNFLNPAEWKDLEQLEKEYQELDEDRIKDLHVRLRPYFLRRIKSEVLQLPAKNEVIVPVSMASLQKEVYRSILSHNLDILNGLTRSKVLGSIAKGKLNNILMHLRKCLQHPYLYSEDIEPKGLSNQEAHEKLIDASSKFRLLKSLLPKLKERGHRVLLFSQFVLALDVIEDFLNGEGYKYLRLDGNTKGTDRQKGMDEFNRPGSDVFIYLLTTRAGGVGINLFSADTVIIFDPDFNPHQDLQAISRAYRYGQKKTCLVFKLMVKDSAEERIMQIGKKKLVLDHLIVQKMDDDVDGPAENIQSILTYGAQALFEEQESNRDITYSDQDIQKLIEKTEVEGEDEEKPKEGMSFSFAKIWAADKDALEEVEDNDQADSWAQTLRKIEEERKKEAIKFDESGRKRRKAATLAQEKFLVNQNLAPAEARKQKTQKKNISSRSDASESAYTASDNESIEEDSDIVMEDIDNDYAALRHQMRSVVQGEAQAITQSYKPPTKSSHRPSSIIQSVCSLCGERHGDSFGECAMTDSSKNLAEYREILILHADDEPWETRFAAIRAIEEVLRARGHLSLIAGQPLHPVPPRPQVATTIQSPILKAGPLPGPSHQTEAVNGFRGAQPQIYHTPNIQATFPMQANHLNPNLNTNVVAGPSKRPSSPPREHVNKKAKVSSGMKCVVCGLGPAHQIKDCDIVRAGSKSISRHIERLERDPNMAHIVEILRKYLRKVKLREMEIGGT